MEVLNSNVSVKHLKEQGRFGELDAMRGLAALVVVVHHFRNTYYHTAFSGAGISSLLYPFVAGHESVIFFFLLSGFVLALPYLHGKGQPYFDFLRRRILRIYGPYLGALALAVAGCALWHNRVEGTWNAPPDTHSIVQHILFIGNYDFYRYNAAFWSLVYEMRISIVFPLLFLVVNRLPAKGTLLVIAICALVGIHTLIIFEYVGIFLLGILLAQNREILHTAYRHLSVLQRILLALAAFVLYTESHLLTRIGPLWHLGDMPIVLGAAGLILVALNSATAYSALNSAVPAFLGRISYSLYLVHCTVLFTLAAVLKNVSPPVILFIYLPATIVLSWCFYVAVEAPFTRLSHKVGKRTSGYKPRPRPLMDSSTISETAIAFPSKAKPE